MIHYGRVKNCEKSLFASCVHNDIVFYLLLHNWSINFYDPFSKNAKMLIFMKGEMTDD